MYQMMRKGSFLHLRTVWRKLTMQPSTPRQSPTSTRTSALGKGSCAWVTFVHRQMAFTTQLGLELWDGVPCGCHSTFKSSDTTQSLPNSLQLAFPTCVSTLYSSLELCPGGKAVAYFRDRIFHFLSLRVGVFQRANKNFRSSDPYF